MPEILHRKTTKYLNLNKTSLSNKIIYIQKLFIKFDSKSQVHLEALPRKKKCKMTQT